MKKKVILLALLLALCTLSVTGSLAYFMADDEAENVMTFGTIKVEQKEDFIQNQYLYPIVNTTYPSEDEYYIEKRVTVENTGTSEAYVRTFIAYPKELEGVLILDTDQTGKWKKDPNDWGYAVIEGYEYKVISYTYHQALASGKGTEAVLLGVYLDPKTDAQINPSTGKKEFCTMETEGSWTYTGYSIDRSLDIYVVTQASQTTGLSSDPQEALNTAFANSAPDIH